MTPQELTEAQQRLESFTAEVFGSFGRTDQRRWGERYVRGLLGEGRRKSMEPMAARLGVDRQGLQQFLADSPWSHQMVLAELAWRMEPAVRPAAWVIDDVSFPKDGHASPGVAAQYCGALGKTANCQVAPSVHLVTDAASCPVNWRLFLPEQWDPTRAAEPDQAVRRRLRARIPDDVGHVEKWQLAVDMVDELRCWGLDPPLIVADEGYGQDGAFRLAWEERGICYVVGVRSDTAVLPETATRTAPAWSGTGRKPVPCYRDKPTAVRELVLGGGRGALHRVTWRQGSRGPLRSRFAALRVRPAGRRIRQAHPGQDLPVC
ncbi:IS701 family transposase, partial [Streptomyces sp. M2CJ-2]|uniref:IS701 family transposase n=1 Tax=Streptomyces sp. M2CJ-2 TaxID=2803948 RepID=UPI001926F083